MNLRITRMITKVQTIPSCFRIKHPNPKNPFKISSSSSLHTSKQPTLRLSDLSTAFECINNIDEAEALFHYMLQMKPTPTVSHFNMLLQAIVRMEHYTRVIHMFKKLAFLGREVDDYTMNTVINCYGYLEQVELSFAVIACFVKRGYGPDIVTFNCLMKGLFLKGKVDEGVGLFKNLVKGELYEVNEITMLTVLDGLCKSENVVEALELVCIAEKNSWKLDVACYTAVIDGLCEARMLEDGMELLFRMVDRDVIPNVVTYNCLIHGLCMNGKFDSACSIFNGLSDKGVYPTVITYTVMIQGLLREGLFRDAKELLERMERFGCFPDVVTYRVIVQGCLHHLHSVDSVNLLEQIVGKDFQLDAASFFVVLPQIRVVRNMKGVIDDDVCNQLIRKLISSAAIHQIQNKNYEFVINSLINKLISSDS